jgi:hypothetical protein
MIGADTVEVLLLVEVRVPSSLRLAISAHRAGPEGVLVATDVDPALGCGFVGTDDAELEGGLLDLIDAGEAILVAPLGTLLRLMVERVLVLL